MPRAGTAWQIPEVTASALPANARELEQLLGEIARTPEETSGDFLGRLVAALRPGRVATAAEAAGSITFPGTA